MDGELHDQQGEPSSWADGTARLAAVFRTKTLVEWCELLEGTDTCFAPVLAMHEAPSHPHNVERQTFVEVDGVVQPAPAPRFSRTPTAGPGPPTVAGEHTTDALVAWGFEPADVDGLLAAGVVGQRPSS